MSSDFNVRKAAQVVAYLANKSPTRRLHVLMAVKLVYLADRESMEHYGFPILDEDRYSLPFGPVNSTTYRHISGEVEDPEWSFLLRDRANHEISVKPAALSCDWDELSDADLECLDTVWEKFGHMDRFQLVKWTHDPENIPEWEDPQGSSAFIPLSRIFKLLKIENAKEHVSVVEDARRAERLLASLRK